MSLKRTGPPERRTPLTARTPLERRPMARTSEPRPPRPPKPMPGGATLPAKAKKQTDWSPQVRAEVARRSGGRCELGLPGCWRAAAHIHHRLSRASGDHREVNAIHVCLWCHTGSRDSIHGAPAVAREHGWIVDGDPGLVPWSRPNPSQTSGQS